MNKKLNEALDKELKRFNSIIGYEKKLIEENYYFHQQLPEAEEDPIMDPNAPNPGEAPGGQPGNAQGGVPDPNAAPAPDPNAGIPDPSAGGVENAPDTQGGVPDMGAEGGDEMGVPDMDSPDMGAEGGDMGGGDATEVDVTELVNNSNELKMKMSDMVTKVDQSAQYFSNMMNKVNSIEGSLTRMDSLISKMEELSRQVELMRPPTEAERQKALAKDSYPYSVTLDDYQKGSGAKTQTDLEKDPKMSMMKTIMSDYNDSGIKDSFNVPQENPLKNFQ